jgi:hypothetical protein
VDSFNPLQVLPATQIRRQIMSDVYGEDGDMNDKRERRDKLQSLIRRYMTRVKLKSLISGYMICQLVRDVDDVKFSVEEVSAEVDELLRRMNGIRSTAQRSHKLN